MEKPISVILSDLSDSIINEIKNSNIHPMILEPIIRDIYNMVLDSAKQQKEVEVAEYRKYLKEKEENLNKEQEDTTE